MSSWNRCVRASVLSLAFAAGPARADHWQPISFVGADLATQRDGGGGEEEGVYEASFQLRIDDNPRQLAQPDNFAEFRGRARAGIDLASYAAVGGSIVAPAPDDRVSLESDGGSFTSIPFRVTSATLPDGSDAFVDLTLNLKGSLRVVGDGSFIDSTASLSAQVYRHGSGGGYYDDIFAVVGASHLPDRRGVYMDLQVNFEEAPNWESRMLRESVQSTVTPDEISAMVDWSYPFRLALQVGREYSLDLDLSTWGLATNPENVVSVADVFTGAGYGASASLQPHDPAVSIVFIPEPAAGSAIALLSLFLLRPRSCRPRHRRRAPAAAS